MDIIVCDDEKLAEEGLVSTVRGVMPEAKVLGFTLPADALNYAEKNKPEVAFLDINMREINGLVLAERMKEMNPRINIIFTTGYSAYTSQAMDIHASGYIMKPVTEDKVRRELMDLRYQISSEDPKSDSVKKDINRISGHEIWVRTFGNFEIFIDGEPAQFQYSKTKEFFAYLVDRRGALVSNEEIMDVLWEDRDTQTSHLSYFKNLRTDLFTAFESVDRADVLIRQRGKIGVRKDAFGCDYFDYLESLSKNPDRPVHLPLIADYMSQYSWAELTRGSLQNMLYYRA